MFLKRWLRVCCALALVAGAALAGSFALAEDPSEAGPELNAAQTPAPQAPASQSSGEQPSGEQPEVNQPASNYWVGMVVRPVDPALRTHLQLPADQGLVVESVMPEGPAAQAGFQQHDLLLRAGDHPLSTPRDLVESVQQSQGEQLKFEVLRAGEKQTIAVTPAERPADAFAPPLGMQPPELDRFRQWAEQMGPQFDGQFPPRGFRNFGFGRFRGPEAEDQQPLAIPEGYQISIRRENDQPAMITVTRGNETWTVTENDVDELPEDVRPVVQQMLQNQGRPFAGGSPFGDMSLFERRFDAMDRRMERLMEEMRALRERGLRGNRGGESQPQAPRPNEI